ncbi:LPS assembly lipoprotein LptE [Acuticoccus mangrovi]|uniref:LPS-assembly lipoprotein n=1 Tax=Acuticoccus mangrovi TaxID=2796142 RepID=A0A934ITN6_9HYPH|nr:LPS assembly lipoprotein LptE [Acuticoccus mangrovi]MBJ3777825.1 hypothetical protein [Acuticoccus mangrovi]
MWSRKAAFLVAAALLVAACQVRPLYMDQTSGGPLSPVPDMRAVEVDPPRNRTEQALSNELLFLLRGDGGPADQARYRLRYITDFGTDPLAVELEEDLPAAVLVTLNVTFILTEIDTDETLLTGAAKATASYDFSSQRFSNVRAERDAATRAAKTAAENIATRLASYFAAKRSDT